MSAETQVAIIMNVTRDQVRVCHAPHLVPPRRSAAASKSLTAAQSRGADTFFIRPRETSGVTTGAERVICCTPSRSSSRGSVTLGPKNSQRYRDFPRQREIADGRDSPAAARLIPTDASVKAETRVRIGRRETEKVRDARSVGGLA